MLCSCPNSLAVWFLLGRLQTSLLSSLAASPPEKRREPLTDPGSESSRYSHALCIEVRGITPGVLRCERPL
jgi:hypothetical protein